uniref:Putative secreted protein n=1 Tax=Ixodes ricinus TaxID=34613 RepID=A0A6B0UAD7_IXORI
MSDWLVQRLLVLARSLTGEMTSSDAPDASSLSPSEPIRGCSCTTLRLLEFLSEAPLLFFRLAMLKVENQLPSFWLPKLLKVLLL